jgi:hypothetical protein
MSTIRSRVGEERSVSNREAQQDLAAAPFETIDFVDFLMNTA